MAIYRRYSNKSGFFSSSKPEFGPIKNPAPVAEAGLARYAATDPVVLDGTGSYDPDGDDIVGYQWQQMSGPAVTIADANTPTPIISGFVQTGSVRVCVFELIVSDGELVSSADFVEVKIVRVPGSYLI